MHSYKPYSDNPYEFLNNYCIYHLCASLYTECKKYANHYFVYANKLIIFVFICLFITYLFGKDCSLVTVFIPKLV